MFTFMCIYTYIYTYIYILIYIYIDLYIYWCIYIHIYIYIHTHTQTHTHTHTHTYVRTHIYISTHVCIYIYIIYIYIYIWHTREWVTKKVAHSNAVTHKLRVNSPVWMTHDTHVNGSQTRNTLATQSSASCESLSHVWVSHGTHADGSQTRRSLRPVRLHTLQVRTSSSNLENSPTWILGTLCLDTWKGRKELLRLRNSSWCFVIVWFFVGSRRRCPLWPCRLRTLVWGGCD